MQLFLDDERFPEDVDWITLPNGPWHIVRSYDDAVAWVVANGFPAVVSFDHDLGVREDGSVGATGYDFAKWLIERDLDTSSMPRAFSFTVHSKNPIGGENIRGLLANYLASKRDLP